MKNDKIESLPRNDSIDVFDGELWVYIVRALEHDKSRPLQTYTHKAIQEIAKVTKSQLNHLVQTKTITPYKEERGRGGRSTYDYTNLLEVMLCREMRKFSVGIHIIKSQLDWLKRKKWEFTFNSSFHLPPEFPEEYLQYFHPDDASIKTAKDVNKSIMYGDFPGRITRTHTIWEYFRIYAFAGGTFFFLFGSMVPDRKKTEEDYTGPKSNKANLYEQLDIIDGVKSTLSSIVVNLSELTKEAYFSEKDFRKN